MLLVLCLLASFAIQSWLLAKLASKSDQAPNTDVDKQCWPVSPGRKLVLAHLESRAILFARGQQIYHSCLMLYIKNARESLTMISKHERAYEA